MPGRCSGRAWTITRNSSGPMMDPFETPLVTGFALEVLSFIFMNWKRYEKLHKEMPEVITKHYTKGWFCNTSQGNSTSIRMKLNCTYLSHLKNRDIPNFSQILDCYLKLTMKTRNQMMSKTVIVSETFYQHKTDLKKKNLQFFNPKCTTFKI